MILAALIGLVILPAFAFTGFEIARAVFGQQQLYNACDAAALAAVATLASADNTDPTKSHNDAMQAALKIFQQNAVLGTQLTQTSISAAAPTTVPANTASLFFEFVNPITKAVEPISSPDAKIVRVYSTYGAPPAFGKYLGLSTYSLRAMAKGAVPQLDIVFCFDVSGSMDDQTPVTCVKRKWDAALGKVVYDVQTGANGLAQGNLYNAMRPGPTGSSLNGATPQNLELAYYNSGMYFSEQLASLTNTPGLRGQGGFPDQGKPPGNCPPGTAPSWDGYPVFTDMIVNIDGNAKFNGFSYRGYNFPDLATVVEASRGNLENSTVFSDSKANTAVKVSPIGGYQQAYTEAAALQLQPIKDSKDASLQFTNILNTDTDCHFGFVAFDGEIGTAANSTEDWYTLDIDTPYGAIRPMALPMIAISPTAGNTGYTSVNAAINSCVPLGSTNIGAAVHQAVLDLKANHRPDSVRAIVLFTDGEPTVPSGPLDSDPWMNARKAAVEAQAEGIPVYTIGLAQNPEIVADETAILNDTNNNATTGGMAAIAGNGGTFNLVTDSRQLRTSFEKIARHLVELVAAG